MRFCRCKPKNQILDERNVPIMLTPYSGQVIYADRYRCKRCNREHYVNQSGEKLKF